MLKKNDEMKMTYRLTYFISLAIIATLLLTSIYFQVMDGILPCPLCTLQRIAFVILGLLFLIGIFVYTKHKPRFIINVSCMLISLLGMFFAGRQVWLQHFPSEDAIKECGVSLQYMMQVLPMNEVIAKIFSGSAECTQRGWEFLSMNMAEWALIWFVVFFLITIYLFIKDIQNNKI